MSRTANSAKSPERERRSIRCGLTSRCRCFARSRCGSRRESSCSRFPAICGRFRDEWRDDRRDFLTTLSVVVINAIYVALAVAGAWMSRRRPGWALLIAFVLVRTAYFATFADEAPEPRYVLECFPAVLALGAQAFQGRRQLSSTGSG